MENKLSEIMTTKVVIRDGILYSTVEVVSQLWRRQIQQIKWDRKFLCRFSMLTITVLMGLVYLRVHFSSWSLSIITIIKLVRGGCLLHLSVMGTCSYLWPYIINDLFINFPTKIFYFSSLWKQGGLKCILWTEGSMIST